jgi:hypothetical protein
MIQILSMACVAGILAGVFHATVADGSKKKASDLTIQSALHADTPSPEIPERDHIYDWLIGSWNVRVVDYLDDGAHRVSTGEWHFGWVLEGRAIQDVWISPPRSKRGKNPSKPGNRYGTTLRFYHPEDKKWHVTWINPVSGAHDMLVATKVDDNLVHEGRDKAGTLMRWVFTQITGRTARWYAERSFNGGKTWILEAEFFLERS